jgi:hypothetical protein
MMVARKSARKRGVSSLPATWARGAVGSASDWQSEGQGFESPRVHQIARFCMMLIRITPNRIMPSQRNLTGRRSDDSGYVYAVAA